MAGQDLNNNESPSDEEVRMIMDKVPLEPLPSPGHRRRVRGPARFAQHVSDVTGAPPPRRPQANQKGKSDDDAISRIEARALLPPY